MISVVVDDDVAVVVVMILVSLYSKRTITNTQVDFRKIL